MNEPAADTRSAGALLRAAREKQGLHIAALGAAIKVSQRKLEALEGDRFDELPDATFTRALAQTVCRQLKIDAKPVLDLLPPASAVTLDTHSGSLNAPFRERPGRGDDAGGGGIAVHPVVLGAGVLVVAAAAVYFLPNGLFNRSPQPAAPATVAQPVMPPPAETAASAAPDTAVPTAAVAPEPPASAASPAPEPAAPAPSPVVATAAPTPAAALPPAPTSAPPAAPAAAGLVQLRSSEASWVEARDARGQVLLFRTVQAGESVGLDGALPIRLTIGNAAATQVALRGKPVDLAPRTRDNVARVELQ